MPKGKKPNGATKRATVRSANGLTRILGFEEGSFLGLSVSGAGDINKDGFDDVIVGAPERSEPSGPVGGTVDDIGRAYVIFGKASTAPVHISDLGTGGFIIDGGPGTELGEKVAGGGDFNNDTIPDLLVAGPPSNHAEIADRGKITVVFGKSDGALVNVGTFGTNPGWYQVLGSIADEMAGQDIAMVGDVNGDGFDDFAYRTLDIAIPYVVVFGGEFDSGRTETSTIAGGTGGFAIVNSGPPSEFYRSVASAGDVNNDGKADIIVGISRIFGDEGGAFVIFGKDSTTPVDLEDVKSGTGGGFAMRGRPGNAGFGFTGSGAAGDINNDGFGDLIVSDSGADPNFSGEIYIVHGKDDFALVEVAGAAKGTEGEGEAESEMPFVIAGYEESGIGEVAASVGDMNKDGVPDYLVLGGITPGTRAAYVVFGISQGDGGCGGITHTADQDADNAINLSELLRAIQFFNSTGFGCEDGTEDGYAPNDPDRDCCFYASDYNPQDWEISLSELLRLIQFFNSDGYFACPEADPTTEDGFCPGAP